MKKLELEKAEIENILKRNSGNEEYIHRLLSRALILEKVLYERNKEAQA